MTVGTIVLEVSTQITVSQFSRFFHHITKLTGLSFFDLQNEMRVGKTVNFLLYTDLTLKEMADEVREERKI